MEDINFGYIRLIFKGSDHFITSPAKWHILSLSLEIYSREPAEGFIVLSLFPVNQCLSKLTSSCWHYLQWLHQTDRDREEKRSGNKTKRLRGRGYAEMACLHRDMRWTGVMSQGPVGWNRVVRENFMDVINCWLRENDRSKSGGLQYVKRGQCIIVLRSCIELHSMLLDWHMFVWCIGDRWIQNTDEKKMLHVQLIYNYLPTHAWYDPVHWGWWWHQPWHGQASFHQCWVWQPPLWKRRWLSEPSWPSRRTPLHHTLTACAGGQTQQEVRRALCQLDLGQHTALLLTYLLLQEQQASCYITWHNGSTYYVKQWVSKCGVRNVTVF